MPFGAGNDMIKSFKSNRKQLTKKRSLKESYEKFGETDLGKSNFKKVPEEDIIAFKKAYAIKKKEENRKNLMVALTVFVVLGIVFYVLLFIV